MIPAGPTFGRFQPGCPSDLRFGKSPENSAPYSDEKHHSLYFIAFLSKNDKNYLFCRSSLLSLPHRRLKTGRTPPLRIQQTENGQKTEKNLCGAICWSFTSFYFLALAAGFIHSFVPHVSSSLATGWQAASEDIRMQEKHGIAQHTYFLAARLQNAQSDETLFPIETGHASISTEAEYTGVNIYVKTDENSDPTVVRTLNRINYILLLSIRPCWPSSLS